MSGTDPRPVGFPLVTALRVAGWTALHQAAAEGSLELARLLLDRGAAIEARSPAGRTPLWVASAAESATVGLGRTVELFLLGGTRSARRMAGGAHRGSWRGAPVTAGWRAPCAAGPGTRARPACRTGGGASPSNARPRRGRRLG